MAKDNKTLNEVFDKLKDMGTSSVDEDSNLQYIPTGSISLDLVLSGGKGFPKGKSVLLSSESGAGKTHILLCVAKAFARAGLKLLILDYEGGINDSQIDGLGMREFWYSKENPKGTIYYKRPMTFGEGEEVLDPLIETGELDLVMVDSVTGMVPDRFLDTKNRVSVTTAEPGIHARMEAVWFQKYNALAKRYGTSFFYITQTRTRISFIGSSKKAAGGEAMKFFTDIRLFASVVKKLEKEVKLSDGSTKSVQYGAEIELWAEKNRHARPFIPVSATIFFGKGVSNISCYIDWLKRNGNLVQGGGGYYTLKIDDKEWKPRGEPAVYKIVKENLGLIKDLVDSSGGFKLYEDDSE